MKKIYLVSISGGKDSQATLIYMLRHYKKEQIRAYFCDTGWEHRLTYEHIAYLSKKLDIKIDVVKSDKFDGFADMCIKKGVFPNRIMRFCTQELKVYPAAKYIKSFMDKGYKVVNVIGIRKQESKARANAVKWRCDFLGNIPKSKKASEKYYKQSNSFTCFCPIVDWDVLEVYDYNTQNGTKNNPLYAKGFDRVGCFPCINARKNEISLLDNEAIQKVAELELAVNNSSANKGKNSFFFYKDKKPSSINKLRKDDKYRYNTLNLDLGCLNRYGKCE